MAIAGNIVHMMNGTITVDSVLGEGSCFRVNVPLKIQEQSVKVSDEFSGLSVLLVDDDRDVCENASALLKELGVDVQWVLNGYDAVDVIRIAHEKNADFFAAIIDWKMPGMNGFETVRAIREQIDPDLPLIIMSAYDYSDIGEELKEAAADAFMTKPLFRSKLVRILRQFLEKRNVKTSKGDVGNFSGDLDSRRLLLVEDNDLNRDIARELLELKGAIVDVAQNGRQAVDLFSASPEGWYDLILMDIQMPVMNGYEACAAIRAMGRKDAKKIPVLALTANAFVDDVIKAKKAGMNGHLAKPVDADKMIALVKKWLFLPENFRTK